jgi:hypothetical protein
VLGEPVVLDHLVEEHHVRLVEVLGLGVLGQVRLQVAEDRAVVRAQQLGHARICRPLRAGRHGSQDQAEDPDGPPDSCHFHGAFLSEFEIMRPG